MQRMKRHRFIKYTKNKKAKIVLLETHDFFFKMSQTTLFNMFSLQI